VGLLLLCVATPAGAGVITGTVRVPSPTAAGPQLNPYPGRISSMPGAHGPKRGLVVDAVVFVERIPVGTDSLLAQQPRPRPRLAQKDQCFEPRVVAVALGGAVDFPNLDPIYHNVFSPSPVKRFDLGKYPKGQSRRVIFPRAGVVNVFCDIHSDMEAFVLVLPHHAYTQPDADGRYTLPDLPPGTYVLRAWHPDLREVRREVVVPETGELSLDLAF
jgi:hypothetical protein